jgi:hypothetical protein
VEAAAKALAQLAAEGWVAAASAEAATAAAGLEAAETAERTAVEAAAKELMQALTVAAMAMGRLVLVHGVEEPAAEAARVAAAREAAVKAEVEAGDVIRGSPIAHEGTNRSLVDLVALQQPKRSNLAEKVQQPPLDAVEEARAVAWHVKHREPEALYALDGVVDRGADHLARREPVVGRQVGLFGRPVVGRAFLMKRKRNEKKRKETCVTQKIAAVGGEDPDPRAFCLVFST